jgi:hypothetical protein
LFTGERTLPLFDFKEYNPDLSFTVIFYPRVPVKNDKINRRTNKPGVGSFVSEPGENRGHLFGNFSLEG